MGKDAVVGVITNNSETNADDDMDPSKPIRFQKPYRFSTPLLFDDDPVTFELPQLVQHPLDDALDELEILGFSLCNPFDLVDDDPGLYVPAARMQEYLGQTVTMLGYLITWKPVHTVKKEMMYFGTYIDAAGDWLDTVHFPDSAKRYPLQGRGFYRMTGRVVEEFGVFNLEVERMDKIGIKDRAAVKAGSLLEKDKSWKQGLIRRE